MVGLEVLRHSVSHVLAIAVKELYPKVKLGIGPAIDDGFYYDFDNLKISDEDLVKIEKKMNEIVKKNLKFERQEKTVAEAKKILKDEPYKLDLLKEISKPIFYKTGDFIDMCAGPHIKSTGEMKAFKLLKLAGAYWKGDSKNKMLTRIYGTAFETKQELDAYLKALEEAKLRDHRKIGKDMDLFSFSEYGPGFPFFHPKGMVIRNIIEGYWKDIHARDGYKEVKTPIILNRTLWEKSGHWEHYKENMYFTKIDNTDFAVKPMNCPGGVCVYKDKIRSYKDLPLKYSELGLVHRHELAGVLHGLFRVRMFTQDDAHVYCLPEQVQEEIAKVIDLCFEIYSTFGFKDVHVELSTRPKDFMGKKENWDSAEKALKKALDGKKIKYKLNEGEGAFYGPKIDFHISDCMKRTWQCGTIQVDFAMPETLDIHYMGEDGNYHRPVMIHRAILGSLERFIGILLENYSGKLPLWLSPVHVKIMTVNSRNEKFALEVKKKMEADGLRVELDNRTETIGRKVRDAQIEKVPYMVTLGDKEEQEKKLAVRDYYGVVKFGVDIGKFIKDAVSDIKERKFTLVCSKD